MDSNNTNDAVDYGLANERWLTIYKYYLMAAVALSVFGFAKFIVIISGRASGAQLVDAFVYGIAQIGLFVFALRSLKRVGEKWVRILQLSINGVPLIIFISGLTQILPYNIFMRVGSIAFFPISALIPWQLVNELSLGSPVRALTYIASLTFAAYFFFRWLKSVRPAPVMTTDSHNTPPPAAEQQTKAANSGGGRLGGLISLIVGIIMFLSGYSGGSISSGGALLLVLLGLGLMLIGVVIMIFGRWTSLIPWWWW